MARAHEVAIGADGREFSRAVKSDVIKPVEDAARALDDLGDDGAQSMGKLEDALKDVQNQSEKTGRDIGRNMDDGFDKAKRGMDDFKSEADSTAKEAAASFDGSAESVGDAFQELAANLGPGGVIGAVVIGSLIALATSAVENWEEKVQGIKDSTAEMWEAAAEEGRSFIDSTSVTAEAYRLLWDKTYEDQFKAAEEAGIKRSELALALAEGEGEAYDRVTERLTAAFREQTDAARVGSEAFKEGGDAARVAAEKEAGAIGATLGLLREKGEAVDLNRKLSREAQDVTEASEKAQREQIKRTSDAAQERYEKLADLYSNPIKAKVVIEVDDSNYRRWQPAPKYGQVKTSPSGRVPV